MTTPRRSRIEVTKAGDVQIYGSTGTDMVSMPLALNAQAIWWARGMPTLSLPATPT